jgi:hypothetical protein
MRHVEGVRAVITQTGDDCYRPLHEYGWKPKECGKLRQKSKEPGRRLIQKNGPTDRTMFDTPAFSTAACRQRKLFEQAAASEN